MIRFIFNFERTFNSGHKIKQLFTKDIQCDDLEKILSNAFWSPDGDFERTELIGCEIVNSKEQVVSSDVGSDCSRYHPVGIVCPWCK